jgi:hypothetical protein
MTTVTAWQTLTHLWHCPTWSPIPDAIQTVLHLGMFRGALVTRAGAAGMDEFIKRMNSKRI